MKLFIVVCFSLFFSSVYAQGKFSGDHKLLIGKHFTNVENISGLKGYNYMEGTLLTDVNDPKPVLSDVYKKGTTYIVLVTSLPDSISKTYTIDDVLEVKNVATPWLIRSGTCQLNKEENTMLIALVRGANAAYLKKVKQAWKIDRVKKTINSISVKGVECVNEGFGE